MTKYPYRVLSNGDWLCGWRIRLRQELCYPWSLLLPFSLLHDSLLLTLACEVHRRLKESQDSSLWDLPWLSSWVRKVAWQVHCPCWQLQHFFHGTTGDRAARMLLKVDFKWFLLISDTESVKDMFSPDGCISCSPPTGLQSVQVYSIPCPLWPHAEREAEKIKKNDLKPAPPISSKSFRHLGSAVPTGSSSNGCSVLTPIDMVTMCFPGSVAGLVGPKLFLHHSFWPWVLRLFSWHNVPKA